MWTADSVAKAIAEQLRLGDEHRALRLLADAIGGLRRAVDGGAKTTVEAFLAPPDTTLDRKWSTLFIGLVARQLRLAGIQRPSWTICEPLRWWWWPGVDYEQVPLDKLIRVMECTSPDLAQLGIWLEDDRPYPADPLTVSRLKFRNIDTSPDDPVETWPFEGVLAAVERGSLPDWRRLATAIVADPWGGVAKQVEEAMDLAETPYSLPFLESAVRNARRLETGRKHRAAQSL